MYQRDHLSCDSLNQITESSLEKNINKHKEAISQRLKPYQPDMLYSNMFQSSYHVPPEPNVIITHLTQNSWNHFHMADGMFFFIVRLAIILVSRFGEKKVVHHTHEFAAEKNQWKT